MTTAKLVEKFERQGVMFYANGDNLAWRDPARVLTVDSIETIARCKKSILRLINESQDEPHLPLSPVEALVNLLNGIDDPERRAELQMEFDERAGICEFDGGMSRADAEAAALEQVKEYMRERP